MKKRPAVLIADDDPHMRTALEKRVAMLGYRVVQVSDGLGVLGQCSRAPFDLILLDHEMPNGDGRSIARVIRKETDAPIVFISGHSRDAFRSIVVDLPDVFFLPKPLNDENFAALLAALVPIDRMHALPA